MASSVGSPGRRGQLPPRRRVARAFLCAGWTAPCKELCVRRRRSAPLPLSPRVAVLPITAAGPRSGVLELPSDLLADALTFLPPGDLCAVQLVSQSLRRLCERHFAYLWGTQLVRLRTADAHGNSQHSRRVITGRWHFPGSDGRCFNVYERQGRIWFGREGDAVPMEPMSAVRADRKEREPLGFNAQWRAELPGGVMYMRHEGVLRTVYRSRDVGRLCRRTAHAAPLHIPSERTCHSAVCCGDQMVVLGGMPESSTISCAMREMWLFDLSTRRWRKVEDAHVPAVTEHSAVLWNGRVVVFGGYYEDKGRRNSVFVIDPKAVTVKSVACEAADGAELPPARSSHSSVVVGDDMWVFGGWERVLPKNDLWRLDMRTWTWHRVHGERPGQPPAADPVHGEPPTQRRAHVSFAHQGRVYVYAGTTRHDGTDQDCCTEVVHSFCTVSQRWRTDAVAGDVPCPRSRCRGAAHKGFFYLLGGLRRRQGGAHQYIGDFHQLDCEQLLWRRINLGLPFGVVQHSCTVWRDRLVTFGGFQSDTTAEWKQARPTTAAAAQEQHQLELTEQLWEMERDGSTTNDVHIYQLRAARELAAQRRTPTQPREPPSARSISG